MIFLWLTLLSGVLFVLDAAGASTLTKPPQSAIIMAFERAYEQSLLAYTLSDQGIDATLIVSADSRENLYENLLDIEIIEVDGRSGKDGKSVDKTAIDTCESFLTDAKILQRVREIQPTFVLFPALRHDACLLPWTDFIESIPIIVTHGPEEELYAIQRTRLALPVHTGGIWSGFWSNADSRSVIANADTNYVGPALRLIKERLPTLPRQSQQQQQQDIDFEKLYTRVQLVLTSGDSILRTNFASLNSEPVQIGCHHCRGVHPLPAELQKQLVEYRLGTIVVTLDESYADLVENVARKLPQGRQGQAIAWRNRKLAAVSDKRPENLFVHGNVDRQDLIGYARARVLLSHCEEGELLESAFHGTPVICVPRNSNERENAQRATDLGLSLSMTTTMIRIDDVLAAIEHIHGTASYRETARGISLLIRDRELPASDRLLYWLSYVARNKERLVRLPAPLRSNEIRTFSEDSQLLSGFLLGILTGAALTVLAVFAAWFGSRSFNKRTRKNSKFNR